MRTLRLSLVGTVILILLGGLGSLALAQEEGTTGAEVASEVVWELPVPSEALPEDFVKLVVERWTLAPGTDTGGSTSSVLGNEALRGRALVVEGGEFVITPATEAMLWRGTDGESETAAAGETVTLTTGDAIFLPAVPSAEVEREAPIVMVNPGDEDATALSFHTHQSGGTFYGFPQGLTLGDWDMAYSDAKAFAPLDDTDVLFRLTRTTAEPGALIPTAEAPAVGLYFVEEGVLEQVSSGPSGESVFTWEAGRNGSLPRFDGVEQTLSVASEVPATLLELSAIPVDGATPEADAAAAEPMEEAPAEEATEEEAGDEVVNDTPVVVTGTESCSPAASYETFFVETPAGRQTRDWVSECVSMTSDPRVSGTFRNIFNQDCYTPADIDMACVLWGTHVLDGDQGGWDCSYSGIDDLWGPNDMQVLVVCPGTGEYAGLTYVFQHVVGGVQDFGDGTDTHGIIYEGPPPAWGPIAEPAE